MEGYQILTVVRDWAVAALTGWRLQENFIFGRHLNVDDLVTHEAFRSLGLGSRLLATLASEAHEQG
jgi:GNAT superfamily N-acetyltransferase